MVRTVYSLVITLQDSSSPSEEIIVFCETRSFIFTLFRKACHWSIFWAIL